MNVHTSEFQQEKFTAGKPFTPRTTTETEKRKYAFPLLFSLETHEGTTSTETICEKFFCRRSRLEKKLIRYNIESKEHEREEQMIPEGTTDISQTVTLSVKYIVSFTE